MLLGRDKFQAVDIRIRVKGGGHVAQVYGNILNTSILWYMLISGLIMVLNFKLFVKLLLNRWLLIIKNVSF